MTQHIHIQQLFARFWPGWLAVFTDNSLACMFVRCNRLKKRYFCCMLSIFYRVGMPQEQPSAQHRCLGL